MQMRLWPLRGGVFTFCLFLDLTCHTCCVSVLLHRLSLPDYVREQCRIFGVLQTDKHASNAQSVMCCLCLVSLLLLMLPETVLTKHKVTCGGL